MPEYPSPPFLTRRRLLRIAAGAAAIGAAALMPPNVRRMLAQQPPRNNSLSQGTPQEFVNGLPIDGFRVPCIVISPWTAGG